MSSDSEPGFGDPAELAALEIAAKETFGTHPIFQDIKSSSLSPRDAVSASDPVTALTPFTVEQSLVLLTKSGSPPPSADINRRVYAFCVDHMARTPQESSSLRLFSICALWFREGVEEKLAAAATRATELLQARRSTFDGAYVAAASDVLLLFRVARILGNRESELTLRASVERLIDRISIVEAEAGKLNDPNLEYLLRRSDFIGVQLAFAILESPSILKTELLSGPNVRHLLKRVALDGPFLSTRQARVCSQLQLAPIECRNNFPYEPGLDQYVGRLIAHFATTDTRQRACKNFRGRINDISTELEVRTDLSGLVERFLTHCCRELSQGSPS